MDKMISEIADDEKVARIDDVSPDIDFSEKFFYNLLNSLK